MIMRVCLPPAYCPDYPDTDIQKLWSACPYNMAVMCKIGLRHITTGHPGFHMPHSIASAVHCELIIKKSRFIGCVQPMVDRETAQKVVAELRARHPDANHVCWALLAGGQSAAVDDGEPGGTAGRPMLEVLRHQDLDGVLATAVRYFGGVKLGAGGLVRAYTDCIAQPLKEAIKIPIIRLTTLLCQAPYASEGMVRRAIEAAGASLGDVRHGPALVELVITLPADQAMEFAARLSDASSGRAICTLND